MAKKKFKKVEKIEKKTNLKYPWFRNNKGFIVNSKVPISWQGYVTLILFLLLNFYSVFYFKIPFGSIDDTLGFFVVLLLSSFVFLVIARKKTRGEISDF
jgi:hypothetical protein